MQSTGYSYHILMKLGFSVQILENILILNLMKIRPEGSELFHAG
jgi:hypothetical protein